MNREAVLLILVTVLYHVCGSRAWAQATPTPGNTASSNSVIRTTESQRADDLKSLHALIQRVKEKGDVSIQDNSRIEETITQLIEKEILGLPVARRQELVKKTIGEDDYSTLEEFLRQQLASSNFRQQKGAVDLLGYPLFAVDAADQIKPFVFHPDRMTQYLAVKSLVYLNVAGANHLLDDMILSGALMDYEMSKAIEALYVSNDKNLDRLAMTLLQRKPGGATFKALLPVLKRRDDYRQIVADLFKSNMFSVPDKEDLSMEQRWKARAEHDLLDEIFSDPKSYMADEAIRKKVLIYACTSHTGLYTLALLILEKTGQELTYFTDMQKDNQLPQEKKHVLEIIVSRIQNGGRLK
jgi:hypothetical protein